MPDEPVGTPAAAPAGAGGDSGGSAIPPASVSDTDFLNQPDASAEAGATAAGPSAGSGTEPAASEEINLAALEEGQPQWLAKVTDPAAKAEVGKLLAYPKDI